MDTSREPPKNPKARRAWEKRLPKETENTKVAMFIKGSTCSELMSMVLSDLMNLKKPHVRSYFSKAKNVNCNPFIDPTSIEFFSNKSDASLFAYGSHSKKRPDNLVIGRLFEYHILDMVELRLVKYTPIELYDNEMNRLGSKPCIILSGTEFQDNEEYKKIGNLLVDFFRGEIVESINLAGLDHVISLTVKDGKILFRHHRVHFKKSGTKVPKVELEEIGPSMDFVLRRTQFASLELFKTTLPKRKKGKKKVTTTTLKDNVANVHLKGQNLTELEMSVKRPKALSNKRQRYFGKNLDEGEMSESETSQGPAPIQKYRRMLRCPMKHPYLSSTHVQTTRNFTRFKQHKKNNRNNNRSYHRFNGFHQTQQKGWLFSASLFISGLLFSVAQNRSYAESEREEELIEYDVEVEPGVYVEGLPVYSLSDIAEHNCMEKGVWVYFGDGVYDVTQFVSEHPGGERILMAAGSSIEPFWHVYGQHRSQMVYRILEAYRIGNLEAGSQKVVFDASDPYVNDPVRFPGLSVHTEKPFNAEIPFDLILDNFVTPNELFYVRNHLPVPVISEDEYRLTISGEGFDEVVLTLDDIKKYEKHEVMATIQCAGNRRNQMNPFKKVRGLEWTGGAISNSYWAGAKLRDVLLDLGVDEDKHLEIVEHLHMEAYDTDNTRSYGSSIPLRKALDKYGDVLLAYEMNGQELPRDHGYPIRLVAPGIVGARNVKWLKSLYLSKEESQNHWQQNDYKGFCPSVDWDTVDYNSAPAIQELPVQSAITFPINGQSFSKDDHVEVKGYAWSGGGAGIARVDVSFDGGKNWRVAELTQPDQKRGQVWAWTFWNIDMDLPDDIEDIEIVCKATDTNYNTQPDDVTAIWNIRGVLATAWDRVNIKRVD
eukprot:TRINITY_DN571_c0_g1_i1.p1 TRINITY_DN571_c0_g1~~TRINITY_DN571_c0_g1_i1.p1  ORF type:complete len:890 (-),score=203.17 TRINITY_DN571_c0_g1_i1:2435-5074(-)